LASSRAKLFSRPHLLLPLVLLLAGGIVSADVSSSDAAGQRAAAASCTLNVPSKVAISAPFRAPAFTLGADCPAAGVIDARWEAKRPDGVVMKKAFFNFSYPSSWSVYDTTSLTPMTWYPAGARTPGDITLARTGQATPSDANATNQTAATVPQNTPTTDIRMASTVVAVASPECTGAVWAQRYAITPHGLINYGGISGSIQQLNPTTGGWFVLASFTTDSSGRWQGAMSNPGAGTTVSRRAVIYDAQYIFGSISPTYTGIPPDPICPAAAQSANFRPRVLGLSG
jgi:hypothetical protein